MRTNQVYRGSGRAVQVRGKVRWPERRVTVRDLSVRKVAPAPRPTAAQLSWDIYTRGY